MVQRPNERVLRGGRDIVATPPTVPAGGGRAIGEAVRDVGRVFVRNLDAFAQDLADERAQAERMRGQEAARNAPLRDDIPDVVVEPSTGIFSRAFNQGLREVSEIRFRTAVSSRITQLESEHVANPKGFLEALDAYRLQVLERAQSISPQFSAQLGSQFEKTAQRAVLRQNAQLLGEKVSEARVAGADALEALTIEAQRAALDQLGSDPSISAASDLALSDVYERFEQTVAQVGPDGVPLYTLEEREDLRQKLEASVITSTLRGALRRSADPAARLLEAEQRFRARDDLTEERIQEYLAVGAQEVRRQDAAMRADLAEIRTEVAGAVRVLDGGRDPAGLPELRNRLVRIGDDDMLMRLDMASRRKERMADFIRQPGSVRQQRMADLRSLETLTPDQFDLLSAYEKAEVGVRRALAQDPIGWGAEMGLYGPPADVTGLDPAMLRQREMRAATVREQYGLPGVPFLRPGEADAMGRLAAEGTPGEVVQAFATLRRTVSPENYDSVMEGLSAKSPELAVAGILSDDLPGLASDIVAGQRVFGSVPELRPSKEQRRAEAERVFGNLWTDRSGGAAAAYLDAADALYAGRQVGTGSLEFDGDAYEQALRDVMGRPIEFNGRTVLPPVPGMEEDRFEDLVGRLTDEDLARFGNGRPVLADGTPVTVEMFDRGFFFSDARFVTVGPGRYGIEVPGLGFAVLPDGGGYDLDLRAFQESGADALRP